MRAPRLSLFVIAALSSLVAARFVSAASEDGPAQAEVPVPVPTAAEVDGWVRDLGGADFDARREATRRLIDSGRAAVAPVARVASTGDAETAGRCLEVLRRILKSDDAATKQAAEEALRELSKSENPAIAQRAAAAIAKPDPIPQFGRGGNVQIQVQVGGAVPLVRPNLVREANVEENGKKISIREVIGGEIVVKITETVDGKEQTTETKAANRAELLQKNKDLFELVQKHLRGVALRNVAVAGRAIAGGIAQGNFKMQVRTVNGAREIEVEDGTRKIEISDQDGKDIAIKITRTENGKEKIDEYKAKDVAELKEKHPEGAKIYEQYGSGRNGAFRIQGGAIQIQAVPGQAIPLPAIPLPFEALPVVPEKEAPPAP